MSNRSLFPEGCEIHQKQMVYESDQRVADSKGILTRATSRGVVSGLAVTVNVGAPQTVDVALGSAYAPDGSYMELVAPVMNLAITNTLGTTNYVCMVYDEAQGQSESHKYNGTTKATRATNAPRVVAMTYAQYAALPAFSSQLPLSSNVQSRITILAVINGTGVSLTAGDINLPPSYSLVYQNSQPTNITGVTIVKVDPNTTAGQGTLSFTFGSLSLTWQAPNEGSAGAPTSITTSGAYVVTSLAGVTLLVEVAVSLLPVVNKSDTIIVADLYNRTMTRLTAVDAMHRSMLGSGVVTAANPHGMTLADLAPGVAGTIEEHQDVMHTDGIGRGSSQSLLGVSVNTAPAPDTMAVTSFTTGDSAYINGRRITSISNSTTVTAPIGAPMETLQVYLTEDGILAKRTLVAYADFNLAGRIQVLDVVGNVGNTCRIQHTITSGLIYFDNGNGSYGAPRSPVSVDSVVRVYGYDNLGYADLWVKAGTPGSTVTETLTVTQSLPSDNIMIVANSFWSGSATGFLGFGHGAANAPNFVYDKRVRGNIALDNVSSQSGITNTKSLFSAILSDGLVYDTYTYPGTTINDSTLASAVSAEHVPVFTGTNMAWAGGHAIIGGELVAVPAVSALAFTNNAVSRLFVKKNGVLANMTGTWSDVASSLKGDRYLQVADVTMAAGVMTVYTVLWKLTGYRRDAAGGVVGLDVQGRASIAALSGTGLVSQGGGSGADAIGVIGGTSFTAPAGTAAIAGQSLCADGIGVSGSGTGASAGVDGVNNVGIGAGVHGTSTYNNISAPGIVGESTYGNCVVAKVHPTSNSAFFADVSTGTVAPGLFVIGSSTNTGIIVSGGASGSTDISAVSGDILAGGEFKYGGTRTKNLIIPSTEFMFGDNVTDTTMYEVRGTTGSPPQPYMRGLTGSTYGLVSKVTIPFGATITLVSTCWSNNDGANRLPSIELIKLAYANTTTVFTATSINLTTPTVPTANTTFWWPSPALSEAVTGDTYYLNIGVPTCTAGANLRFFGARITYTYSKVSSDHT